MGIFWRSVKNSVQFPCIFQDTKRAASVCLSTTCGFLSAVGGGFEPPVRLPVRQFSKLVVSATHPSHQTDSFFLTGLQRYKEFIVLQLFGAHFWCFLERIMFDSHETSVQGAADKHLIHNALRKYGYLFLHHPNLHNYQ